MSGSALELTRPSSDETERKKVSAIFNFMEVPVGPIDNFSVWVAIFVTILTSRRVFCMVWDVYCPRRGLGCTKQGVQRGLSLCANLVLHAISFLPLSCLGTLIFSSVLLQRPLSIACWSRDRTARRCRIAPSSYLSCDIEENRKLEQVSR